jgi:hypothetical protein
MLVYGTVLEVATRARSKANPGEMKLTATLHTRQFGSIECTVWEQDRIHLNVPQKGSVALFQVERVSADFNGKKQFGGVWLKEIPGELVAYVPALVPAKAEKFG